MIRMIAAVSQNMVIGKDNSLPWSKQYPEDLKDFKQSTLNSVVIMGRKTFESIGNKPLPKRENIVVSSNKIKNVDTFHSLQEAVIFAKAYCQSSDIWLIGGRYIYQEGLQLAQEIHLTTIPEKIEGENLVYFPDLPEYFKLSFIQQIGENLYKRVYLRS